MKFASSGHFLLRAAIASAGRLLKTIDLMRSRKTQQALRAFAAVALLSLSPLHAQVGQIDPPAAPGGTLRDEDMRVAAVAYRLGVSGLPDCPDPIPVTGMLMHHLGEYEAEDRAAMIDAYGLNRGPGILTVLEGGPAARAGLVAGDVLLSVNDIPFTPGAAIAAEPDAKARRKLIEASEAMLEEEIVKGPARLAVARGGGTIELILDGVPACPIRVRLARSKQVNAFANGRYVIVTTALLKFLKSDDELAVVIAHELSHNILRHPALLDEMGVPRRGVLRGIGKNASRVWKTEAEADSFSIRLLWRAGFDLDSAIPFWRRLYAKYDVFPQIFRTHASIGVRERIVREAIAALPRP